MKNTYKSMVVAVLALLGMAFNAAAVQDPAVTGATVSPAPITSATGVSVSFNFVNQGTAIAASGNFISVTVSLSLLKPNAGFNAATDITGTAAGLFSWSYDAGIKVFTGTLNSAVAQFGGGTITIANLDVTTTSTAASPANGANINVVAPGAVNSSTSNDNTNSYTYTMSNVMPLPVSLTGFSGMAKGCDAVLSWNVAAASDVRDFNLQYSADGHSYETIATIVSKGNNSDYTYIDHRNVTTGSYYRLVITDKSNTTTYSNVVFVRPACELYNITIAPNPVVEDLRVTLTSGDSRETCNGSLYSASGTLVRMVTLTGGTNYIRMGDLPAGLYYLVLKNDNFYKSMKIVRQ